MSDELMTQAEAASVRGVSLAAISDLVKRGRLRSAQKYGRVLVYASDVENFTPLERAGWPKGKPRKSKTEKGGRAAAKTDQKETVTASKKRGKK